MDNDETMLIGQNLAASLRILAQPLIDKARREGYEQALQELSADIREDYNRFPGSHNAAYIQACEDKVANFAHDKGVSVVLDNGSDRGTLR